MTLIKKLFRKIRLFFGLYTLSEVLHVLNTTGNCKDREEYEWKVKNKLFKMLD